MKMVEICGVKYVNGTSKNSGKPYEAYLIYYTEDGRPRGVDGYLTGDAFVSTSLLMGVVPQVGDKVELFYDKRGFLNSVKFVK